jgi:tRNA A-37 threonylcarbamoyl transferase component Bud32
MSPQLGPYEIRGELGRGAMAVVWRAWDRNLEREVALKEPLTRGDLDDEASLELRERFVREGRVAAKLNHPGIVSIYAADIFEDRPAMVMELVQGSTLGALLQRGALTLETAMSVIDQLLEALEYAHEHGVVHRDIKPENVFVTDDGRVKLADFGIAHLIAGSKGETGAVIGTPGYMSPEQVQGLAVDPRSDIFSIGAVTYEVLTGHNPFGASAGDAASVVMYRIANEDPAPMVRFDGAVPPAWQAMVMRALQKRPEDRFASAAEMQAELRRAAMAPAPAASLASLAASVISSEIVAAAARTTVGAVAKVNERRNTMPVLLIGSGIAAVLLIALLFMMPGSAGGSGMEWVVLAAVGIGVGVWFLRPKRGATSPVDPDPIALLAAAGRSVPTVGGTALHMAGPEGVRTLAVPLPATIGRASECEIIIGDPKASRRHCTLQAIGDGSYRLDDLGSRNGTYVGGYRVSEVRLQQGGTFVVGDTEITVMS